MISRPIAILCAAAILLSLFVPWLKVPYGQAFVPIDALWALSERGPAIRLDRVPFKVWLIIAMIIFSFLNAAVFLVAAIAGKENKTTAILGGVLPWALVLWAIVEAAMTSSHRPGLPSLGQDLSSMMESGVGDMIGPGLALYFGGAAVLLLLGIFDPGRKKAIAASAPPQ